MARNSDRPSWLHREKNLWFWCLPWRIFIAYRFKCIRKCFSLANFIDHLATCVSFNDHSTTWANSTRISLNIWIAVSSKSPTRILISTFADPKNSAFYLFYGKYSSANEQRAMPAAEVEWSKVFCRKVWWWYGKAELSQISEGESYSGDPVFCRWCIATLCEEHMSLLFPIFTAFKCFMLL